jgi:hypothetical protein
MKTEKILCSIALIALVMKFFHIPFSGPLLVISLGILSLLYFFGGFYFLNENKKNNSLAIIAGILLSYAPIGILFKIMYWPGAQPMLIVGIFPCITFLIILIIKKANTNEDQKVYLRNLLIRTSIVSSLSILLLFTSTATLIKIQHHDDPEMARLKTQSFENPENEEYRKLYDDYRNKKRGY